MQEHSRPGIPVRNAVADSVAGQEGLSVDSVHAGDGINIDLATRLRQRLRYAFPEFQKFNESRSSLC